MTGKDTGKKILFVAATLLAVVGLLVAAELHLRAETATWYQHKLDKNHALKNSLHIHRKSDDPLLIYELTPGADMDRQGIHYHINQAGFRDVEFPPAETPKPANEFRIIVIGDSVAWGYGVELTEAWPQVLEKNLAGHTGDTTVTIYNMAVNGYATGQEARVLEKQALAYHPDLVILNYVLNDPEVEDGGLSWYFESKNRIELFYQAKLLLSFISNVIETQLGNIKPPDGNSRDHFFLTHHSALFNTVEDGFARIADTTSHNNPPVPVLVIVTPVFQFHKNEEYPWNEIHQKISTLSVKNHFRFLDTAPYFHDVDSADVSQDPIHPSAAGHAIIAKAVEEKLRSGKLLGHDTQAR